MKLLQLVFAPIILFSSSALAQTAEVTARPLTDKDIQLMREDVQSKKNQIISATMQFSEKEAAAFWPVYEAYARDQKAIGDQRQALIKDYAENYASIDDAKAHGMVQRQLKIEDDTVGLRKKYLSQFEKAVGAKRAAQFYQVDNRLSLIVNVQLASVIPIIE